MKGDHVALFLFFCGLLSGPPGCAGIASRSPSHPPSELIQKARKAYLRGASDASSKPNADALRRTRSLARTYLKHHPNGPDAAEAWYRIAQVHHELGAPEKTLKAIDSGLDRAERPVVRAALHKLNGHAHWSLHRAERALEAFRQSRSILEAHEEAGAWISEADVRFWIGSALVRTGSFNEAREVFNELLRTFPDSEAARNARIKRSYLQNHFSLQTGAFEKTDNARKQKQRLKRAGYDPYIVRVDLPDGPLYCVRIGRFDSYRTARQHADRVEREHRNVIIKP